MSVEPALPNSKWLYSPAKFYGWLAGLLIAAFGGLMSSVPIGTLLGIPAAAAGLLLCLSFMISMSGTSVRKFISFPLLLVGLVLLIFGRWLAPVDQIIESFRVGHDVIESSEPSGALGIPLMLIGTILLGTVVPWVRSPEPLGAFRSLVSLALVEFGTTILLAGAVLTASAAPLQAQPRWMWVAVPLAFALGVGLRRRWKGLAWGIISVLTGAVLPLIWFLLT